MNPMQQALMNSRSSNPAPSGAAPVPGTPGAAPGAGNPGQGGPPPEIQAMASDIQDIKASLAKLVEAISGQFTGKAEGSEPVEDEDGAESGEAKTFK